VKEIATVSNRLRRLRKLWVYIYYRDARSVGCTKLDLFERLPHTTRTTRGERASRR
jgi:hypothetical protein